MKQIIILLSAIILMASCEQEKETPQKKKTVIIATQAQDTVYVEHEPDVPTIIIKESTQKLIETFRPSVKDVAYYMLLNKDNFKVHDHHFQCGKFYFWIANDYYWFRLDKPVEIKLTEKEKKYFWKIYNDYKTKEMRLFKYESEIEIVLQKQ